MSRILASVLVASIATSAFGHEFWIAPDDFTVEPGAPITGNLITGVEFEPITTHIFLPHSIRRYETEGPGGTRTVEGRVGDRPALSVDAPDEPGLLRIVHVTADAKLTWKTWEDFEGFVRHKAADWAIERHRDRGLPEAGFTEVYSRYARSLVAVGDGAGEDAPSGLLTEIVALANPYTDDLSDGLPVRVLYQGAPRPMAQVEIFERAPDGAIAISTVTADEDGVATVPVVPGRIYQLDSVVIREPSEEAAAKGGVWESLWANLTFEVPEDGAG